jgi:hypothetical protein
VNSSLESAMIGWTRHWGDPVLEPDPQVRCLHGVSPLSLAPRDASSLPPRHARPNDPASGHCPDPVPLRIAGTPRFLALHESGLALAPGTTRDSMGSEWGLRPLRIGSTTEEVSAIHWFVASRLRR